MTEPPERSRLDSDLMGGGTARSVYAEVPRERGHEPLMIVEYDGLEWLIREVDTANGITVLERTEIVPRVPTTLVGRTERWGWPPAVVAVCAVFLFLALMASRSYRLTFADVIGCLLAFVVLILLLDRRER